VGSEFQVLLERGKDGKDYMTLRVERAEKGARGEDKAVADRIEHLISHRLLVSGKVEWLTTRACHEQRGNRNGSMITGETGFKGRGV